jgi:hypothetical protein
MGSHSTKSSTEGGYGTTATLFVASQSIVNRCIVMVKKPVQQIPLNSIYLAAFTAHFLAHIKFQCSNDSLQSIPVKKFITHNSTNGTWT